MSDLDKMITPKIETALNEIVEIGKRFEIDEDRLYYSLELENDNTGSAVEAHAIKEGFKRQNDRHVTLIGGETKRILKRALEKLTDDEKGRVLKEIKNILESLSWKFEPKEIYKIQKQDYFNKPDILENRESYINMIDMPDMEIFYKKIGILLKIKLPLQVAHITLFTKGEPETTKYYGIPVSSIEDFKAMNPERFITDAE